MNSRPSIREQLLVAGRGRDRAIRLATLLTLVGLLLLLFLGVALMDYQMILPASIRWAALSVLGVTAILGGLRLWQLLRRPTSLKQSALEVEAVRPDVGCEVSTAAEYLTGERTVSRVDTSQYETWTTGMIPFTDVTLANAADELNRYSATKLVVHEAVAGERISGSFRAGDQEAFAAETAVRVGIVIQRSKA